MDKLNLQKQSLLASIRDLPGSKLALRPQADAWCVLDVVDHLMKVERAMVDEFERNVALKNPVTLADRLRAYGVLGVMLSPLRVKVPASASSTLPEVNSSFFEMVEQWTQFRSQMAQRIARFAPEELPFGVTRHPVSGWMDLPLALAFLSAHLQHHAYQVKRIQSAINCIR
jgi:hypothetical protein